MIGDFIDSQVQGYLSRVYDGGGVATARTAVVAAKGILLACDSSTMAEFGGHIQLTCNSSWAYSLLYCTQFVKSHPSMNKFSIQRFVDLKELLLSVVSVLELQEIPGEPILN